MTDDSYIVLRWAVNNATARSSTGKVESDDFDKGGFKWTVAAERIIDPRHDKIELSVRCDVDRNGPWKCDTEVAIWALTRDDDYKEWLDKSRFLFDGDNSWTVNFGQWWSDFTKEEYNINDTVTIEFRIRILSAERGEPIATFSAPNKMSNVILKIGDNMMSVSKEYLAVHSPVFGALFFGDYAEKGKEEVELKDIIYEEFLDLLNVLYLKTMKIRDRTVLHILKLADRFEIERLVVESTNHLKQSKGFDVAKKLLIADQYNLVPLKDHCLQLFTEASDMAKKLKSAPEYANYSDKMKGAICDQIIHLT